ncbi:protein O-mannosyl-transferase 2-like [Teleopsis dalmanni]|uniref:protein O-mannosyl-transferase 2-like n=1 Tax=Teleopsis dalmanni TaxID=139649 RepID=UPI0018CE9E2F|nr:protein O-mannosyl-transferase 2-like [Teleopsis dalmanni]
MNKHNKSKTAATKVENIAKVEAKTMDAKLNWWLIFGVVVLLTLSTRFYKVTEPDHICWDETHFGKMGSWYINRTFFFDVHPPLGKMLIGLSGYLTGYNGTYPFEKPGDKYNGTKYEGMRYFCTTLGALIMPMAFDIVHDMTRSNVAAVISAAYLIFDVGMLTLNQYILLDPILLFFMTASVWGMVKVSKTTSNGASYTFSWWLWLLFTGTMISCTISVKFVGLFVVLLVGLNTANELWIILGDLRKPILETIKQIVCRALTLILWPILLYMVFFYIHLTVLNHSGNGDGFYSSAFQSRLIGNNLYNATLPRNVAYGALVTIKNHKTGGGYLHSHFHLYPKGVGARQQQITTYTHKDDNNKWLLKPYNKETVTDLKLLKNGDQIRLEHVATKRNLHSHAEPAPVTKKHIQVTGYGDNGVGDANDIWRVVIVGGKVNNTVKTVTTKVMFIHVLQNCALTASGKQLPKWGFEQQEVSCNPNLRDKYAYWNFEDNHHKKLPKVNFNVYAPGFFARFIESHAVMFQGNAGLKPKEGEITSRPWQWPINYRGQFFSGSVYRIYLLGNPIIWWSNLVFLALFLIVFFVMAIKERRMAGQRLLQERLKQLQVEQRQNQKSKQDEQQQQQQQEEEQQEELANKQEKENTFNEFPKGHVACEALEPDVDNSAVNNKNGNENGSQRRSLKAATWLFIGWALHYFPFWGMGRVLYFHHYFPALIFNSMLTGVMFNFLTGWLPRWLQHALLGTLLSILAYSFILFSPLAYGMSGPTANEPNSTMHGLKWLPTWEF